MLFSRGESSNSDVNVGFPRGQHFGVKHFRRPPRPGLILAVARVWLTITFDVRQGACQCLAVAQRKRWFTKTERLRRKPCQARACRNNNPRPRNTGVHGQHETSNGLNERVREAMTLGM